MKVNATRVNLSDLLKPAAEVPVRMKLFLFGDTGAGKSWGALSIAAAIGGKVAVLDPEQGTRHYGAKFSFDVLPTDDLDRLQTTVRALAQGGHDYRTLIIDPISLLWSSFQTQWADRFAGAMQRKSSGRFEEFYEIQLKDWRLIKESWELFLRMVIHLDMNVIVTAREKALFDESGGKLRKMGETFDGEKNLPYWFDSVLRLSVTETGKRFAATRKDRTGRLPDVGPAWEWDPLIVAEAFGTRAGHEVTATLAEQDVIDEIRSLGVTLDLSEGDLAKRCRQKWGRVGLDELRPEEAKEVLDKLRAAVDARAKAGE